MKTFQDYIKMRESEEKQAAEYSPKSAKKFNYPDREEASPPDEEGQKSKKDFLDLLKKFSKSKKSDVLPNEEEKKSDFLDMLKKFSKRKK